MAEQEPVLPSDHAKLYEPGASSHPLPEPEAPELTPSPPLPQADAPEPPSAEPQPPAEPQLPAEPQPPTDPYAHLPREELTKRYGDLQGALGEERGRRKAMADRVQQMEKLLETVYNQTPQPQAPAEPPPDRNADPLGYQEWQTEQVLKQLDTVSSRLDAMSQTSQEQTEAQTKHNRIASYASAGEASFTAQHPDYMQAYNHLKTARDHELTLMGISDPAQRQQQIARDEMFLVEQHMAQGTNPAEAVYQLAQARGYQTPRTPVPNGQPPAAQTTAAHLQTVDKAARAAASLSGAGGDAPQQISTFTELAGNMDNMNGKEFDEAFDRLAKRTVNVM